ncbi:MAG: Glycosyltransferase, partial [uncultured Gemmatimonadaceae bacterium]
AAVRSGPVLQRGGGAAGDAPAPERGARAARRPGLRGRVRGRREPGPDAAGAAAAAGRRPAGAGGAVLAQLRAPDRRHGRRGARPRRRRGAHRRRPAGPARGDPRDGGAVARGARRRLRRAHRPAGRERVQAGDRQGVLPRDQPAERDADPARHRRLPPDGPQGGRRARRDARARPLRARDGELGGVPPGGRAVPPRPAARRRVEVPAPQDGALRPRRRHLVLRPAAARGHLARLRRLGPGPRRHPLRPGAAALHQHVGGGVDGDDDRGALPRRRPAAVARRHRRVHRPHLRRGQAAPALPRPGAPRLRPRPARGAGALPAGAPRAGGVPDARASRM